LSCLDGSDRCTPHGTYPSDPGGARKLISDAIKKIVADELSLPQPPSKSHTTPTTRAHAEEYFRETKPVANFAFAWKLFRDAVGSGQFKRPRFFVQNFEDQEHIRNDWSTDDGVARSSSAPAVGGALAESVHSPSVVEDWVNRRLRPHYAWADTCGDMYADTYRSAYVLIYLLSATTVFMALLPMAAGLQGAALTISVAIEFVFLLIIVFLLIAGRRRRWHERWMEYRLLAELIRQIRFLIPLGASRPFPRAPTHLGVNENLTRTWMYWQMRAIARATGIPQAKATPEYVLDCLRSIAKVAGGPNRGQFRFHRDTEKRSNLISHRLHAASTALFVLTIFSISFHLVLEFSGSPYLPSWLHSGLLHTHRSEIDRWLVLAAASLPALGTALTGIVNQGEFARLAKRSAAMADGFEQFAARLKSLQLGDSERPAGPKLLQVIPLAERIAEVMVDEVADWHTVVIEQPVRAA
jgi:hypothetical protein